MGNEGMGRLLDGSVGKAIEAERGGGRPLPDVAAAQPSPQGQADEVRVHDDATAADLSRKLGASAFTFGRDIFLAGNAPELDSTDGQALLRHELTHVEQQERSGTTRPRRVSSPGSPAEREATRAATGISPTTAVAGAGAVHRQPLEEEEEAEEASTETVHRQPLEEEEEAEEASTETVHQETSKAGEKEAGDAAQAPANPALAALFDATVLEPHREALNAVTSDPADTAAALDKVRDAWKAVSAVSKPYEDSDPLLFNSLRRYQNALNVAMQRLNSIEVGPASTESVAMNLAHEQVMGLGERLRDQLH